jgi:hypothetical protein
MPEKFNAARRVRNILSTARKQDEKGSTLNAWGSTFQTLDLPNPQFETFRLLQLLIEQVDNLAIEVEDFGLDRSDYQVTFNSLYNILKITNLDTPWQHYQRNITDEVIRQLGMFAQWSQIDEPMVPVEDIAQLKEDLQRFQHEVLQSDIDERLRAFVLKQIRTILGALREYPIRGEEAIEDGDTTLLATFISEHELLREHKGEEVVEETMSMWERMTNLLPWGNFFINLARILMDADVDPQKAIEAGSKAIEAGRDIVDKLP